MPHRPGEILVLAGVNGAGKSSIAGSALWRKGATHYDPDLATHRYREAGLTPADANSRAWHRGRLQLERSIRDGSSYAFETTLGGRTITRLLIEAADAGLRVRLWYAGLTTPELHIQRVRERVLRGGHDIPEVAIRARWTSSRENLVRLLPHLAELAMVDNSRAASPHEGIAPTPFRILHARDGVMLHLCPPSEVPSWAKPLVVAALKAWSGA